MPHIIVVFGLAGAGKSTIATIIQEQFDYYHQEGDLLLTPTLIEKLKHQDGNPLYEITNHDILEFVQVMIESVHKSLTTHPNIVLSQAFYAKESRDKFLKAFEGIASVTFVQVNVRKDILLNRLDLRSKMDATAFDRASAEHQEQWFEPMPSAHQIDNTLNDPHSDLVLKQITAALKINPTIQHQSLKL